MQKNPEVIFCILQSHGNFPFPFQGEGTRLSHGTGCRFLTGSMQEI
jgi:hypothetical protein